MICNTFIRDYYKKRGIQGNDLLKVLSPEGQTFHFICDNKIVTPEPASKVLSLSQLRAYETLLALFPVEPGSCHFTALVVAQNVPGIQVCDGFYIPKDDPSKALSHTFCKVGDKYFDPTIENVRGKAALKEYTYQSIRVFEPKELQLYFAAVGRMKNCTRKSFFACSTLEDDGSDDFVAGVHSVGCILDDAGRFHKVTPPVYYHNYEMAI